MMQFCKKFNPFFFFLKDCYYLIFNIEKHSAFKNKFDPVQKIIEKEMYDNSYFKDGRSKFWMGSKIDWNGKK